MLFSASNSHLAYFYDINLQRAAVNCYFSNQNYVIMVSYIGNVSCVICLFLTFKCAAIFSREYVHVGRALTFYGMQWACLLVYYSAFVEVPEGQSPQLQEILPAMSGFLCVFTGTTILRMYRNRSTTRTAIMLENLAVIVFIAAFLPTGFEAITKQCFNYGSKDLIVIITLALKFLGFQSMFLAAKTCSCSKRRTTTIGIILLIYFGLELAYAVLWIVNICGSQSHQITMSPFFLWAFSGIKLATCPVFVLTVMSKCRCYKKLDAKEKIRRILL